MKEVVCYSVHEVVEELLKVQKAGFGELLVRVHEHDVVEVVVTERKRKPRPASRPAVL